MMMEAVWSRIGRGCGADGRLVMIWLVRSLGGCIVGGVSLVCLMSHSHVHIFEHDH